MIESRIVGGYWLEHAMPAGHVTAQVYAPRDVRRAWALCIGDCSGTFAKLRGAYELHDTKRAAVESFAKLLAQTEKSI